MKVKIENDDCLQAVENNLESGGNIVNSIIKLPYIPKIWQYADKYEDLVKKEQKARGVVNVRYSGVH